MKKINYLILLLAATVVASYLYIHNNKKNNVETIKTAKIVENTLTSKPVQAKQQTETENNKSPNKTNDTIINTVNMSADPTEDDISHISNQIAEYKYNLGFKSPEEIDNEIKLIDQELDNDKYIMRLNANQLNKDEKVKFIELMRKRDTAHSVVIKKIMDEYNEKYNKKT